MSDLNGVIGVEVSRFHLPSSLSRLRALCEANGEADTFILDVFAMLAGWEQADRDEWMRLCMAPCRTGCWTVLGRHFHDRYTGPTLPTDARRQLEADVREARTEAEAHAREASRVGALNASLQEKIAELEARQPQEDALERAAAGMADLTRSNDALRANLSLFEKKAEKIEAELLAVKEELRVANDAYKALQTDYEGRLNDGRRAAAIEQGRRREQIALLRHVIDQLGQR